MKAILDRKGIVRIIAHDSQSVPANHTAVAIGEEQAALVAAGQKTVPRLLYTFADGQLALVPGPVPQVVPAWRVKAVASLQGLTAQIDAALDALPDPAKTVAKAAWHEGNVVERRSATVVALTQVLGLTEQTIDELFRQAAALKV